MEKQIQIIPESKLDEKTLDEIRNQEFVGKKRAKISKKAVVISCSISLFSIVLIFFVSLLVSTVYSPEYIYNKYSVSTDEIELNKLEIPETDIVFTNLGDAGLTSNDMTGDYAEDASFFYVSGLANDKCIYKISKKDYKKEKITDISGTQLNIVNNNLIFANASENNEYERGIYQIHLDSDAIGENIELICRITVEDMIVKDGNLYYIDSSNQSFYMMGLDEREEILIDSGNYVELILSDGKVYLLKEKKGEYTVCYLSETGIVKTIDTTLGGLFCICEDELFVYKEDGVHIINIGDDEDEADESFSIHVLGKMDISNKRLIYIDESDKNKIGILNLEDRTVQHLNIENVVDFDLLDNLIIIHFMNDNGVHFTVVDSISLECIKFF